MQRFKSGIIAMGISSFASLVAVACNYLYFSRELTANQFGLYAAAIFASKIGATIVDGGARNALVKKDGILSEKDLSVTFTMTLTLTLLITLLSFLFLAFNEALIVPSTLDAKFIIWYGLSYVITYPFIGINQGKLERELKFKSVARIETISIFLEYVVPIIFWVLGNFGLTSFVFAVWFSRIARVILTIRADQDIQWMMFWKYRNIKPSYSIIKESIWIQLSIGLSSIRDNLHIILIGPIFGGAWVGYYSWAMQLCAVTSQVFVQTATRVALPSMRGVSQKEKVEHTLIQTKWLAIMTIPPLMFLPVIAPNLNDDLFKGKWEQSMPILLLLVIRMLPSIATTTVGALLLTSQGAKKFASASFWWTAAEVALAFLLIRIFNVMGVAYSYSFGAIFGAYLLCAYTNEHLLFSAAIKLIVLRPSLWVSLILSTLLFSFTETNTISLGVLALFGILTAYFSEISMRKLIRSANA